MFKYSKTYQSQCRKIPEWGTLQTGRCFYFKKKTFKNQTNGEKLEKIAVPKAQRGSPVLWQKISCVSTWKPSVEVFSWKPRNLPYEFKNKNLSLKKKFQSERVIKLSHLTSKSADYNWDHNSIIFIWSPRKIFESAQNAPAEKLEHFSEVYWTEKLHDKIFEIVSKWI